MKPTKEEIISHVNSMRTFSLNHRTHVIVPIERYDETFPDPNYCDTGCAGVGVLKKGQTLNEFKEKYLKDKLTLHEL